MKKNLIVLISLMMAMNALAEVTWNGTSSTAWTQGAGTAASPYILSSPAHLKYLADQVKAGTTYAGKYFKQTQDFNLNSKAWIAIGNNSLYPFEGNYDGNNKYISNLYNTSANVYSLFCYINNATIKNVTIQGTTTGRSAALVSETSGDCVITNCHNKVNVSGTSICGGLIHTAKGTSLTLTGCSNSGTITAGATYSSTDLYVGGLIGSSQVEQLTLTSCSNTGLCTWSTNTGSAYSPVGNGGGLIGKVSSGTVLVDQCFSIGDVYFNYVNSKTGHIIGELSSSVNCTIQRSYAKGTSRYMMIGSCSSTAVVKGCYVVGAINFKDHTNATLATIISCYYVGSSRYGGTSTSITGWSATSRYCFYCSTDGWNMVRGTSVSQEELQDPSFLARINKEEEYFVMDYEGINDGYPILKWQAGTRYKIMATCDANRGTVSGGGVYPNGYSATLTATPKEGCMFVGWSDGNTDNPRTVTVNGAQTYTAQFTKSSYTIYVNQDGTSNIE